MREEEGMKSAEKGKEEKVAMRILYDHSPEEQGLKINK